MLQLPPIPSWAGIHPLVVHFPVALLLVAPVFLVIAIALPAARARHYLAGALLLMVLGTAAASIAVESGEAAGVLAERTPEISAALERHQHLAVTTRNVFLGLTLAFAAAVLVAGLRKPSRVWTSVVPAVFVVAYAFAAVLLANTAHQGGTLVHRYGVHAIVAGSANAPAAQTAE